MKRITVVLVLLALAGCYSPRWASDSPGTDHPKQAPVTSSSGAPGATSSDGQPVMSSGDERRR